MFCQLENTARTEQRRNLCPPSQSKLGPSVRFCLRLWYVRTLCEASDYMWVCLRLAPAGAVPVTYTTLSPASQGAPKTQHTPNSSSDWARSLFTSMVRIRLRNRTDNEALGVDRLLTDTGKMSTQAVPWPWTVLPLSPDSCLCLAHHLFYKSVIHGSILLI